MSSFKQTVVDALVTYLDVFFTFIRSERFDDRFAMCFIFWMGGIILLRKSIGFGQIVSVAMTAACIAHLIRPSDTDTSGNMGWSGGSSQPPVSSPWSLFLEARSALERASAGKPDR